MSSAQVPNISSSISSSSFDTKTMSTIYTLVAICNCVEFLPLFLLSFFSIFNAWMLAKSSILHINLKTILITQSMVICIYAAMRIIRILWSILYGWVNPMVPMPSLIGIITVASINFGNLIGHVMIVERTMATLRAQKYENSKGPWFSIFWISLMALMVLLQQLFPSFNQIHSFGFTVLITHLALVFSGIELILFFYINMHNLKKYAMFNDIHTNIMHRKYNLGARYQLLENINSGRQLTPSFFLHFINIIASNLVCIFYIYWQIQSPIFDLVLAIIYLFHVFSKMGIEITVITFHPVLRRKLHNIWMNLSKSTAAPRIDTIKMKQIGNGIDREDLQRRHFKVLEHFWQ